LVVEDETVLAVVEELVGLVVLAVARMEEDSEMRLLWVVGHYRVLVELERSEL
jgi:hypothetical protein